MFGQLRSLAVAGQEPKCPEAMNGREGGDIIAIPIEYIVTIRDEINRIAKSDRIAIGARIIGDVAALLRGHVEDVEILRPTALVTIPRKKIAGQRRVHQLFPDRRIFADAGDRHHVYLILAAVAAGECDLVAVW